MFIEGIMLVLGIETSCDDTGLALVDENGLVSSVMASQVPLHALFGGVVPELASREHARLIGPLLDKLLADSGKKLTDIDRIAVTRGPGLLGSLLVGVAFAKSLSLAADIPLIGVNHLHAHLLVAGLENNLSFPALGVLVSGGHTHLIQMNSPVDMKVWGKTLDDAAGEACDKFGKMLGLPYPGGMYLDKLGQLGKIDKNCFPRPYTKNENYDFSFSGMKTAASLWLEQHPDALLSLPPLGQNYSEDFFEKASEEAKNAAASYLYAIADTLVIKAKRVLKEFAPKCIVVAGGVAANSFVRRQLAIFADENHLPLYIPKPKFCSDNGIMVAYAGLLLAKMGLCHDENLTAIARGKPIPHDYLQTL